MSGARQLSQMAKQCLLLGFVGPEPPRWVLDGLAGGLGGLVLFGNNLAGGDERIAALTERLRSAAGRDVVLAVDEEGGDVTRLDQSVGSRYPGAAALGHLDDPATTEEVHAAMGARLARVGVTVDFAPVADVNSEARNPVIGVRSFSADSERAARHVNAAVRGLQRSGMAACVKHFPGHGASVDDSHHQVAVLRQSRAQLEEIDLVPFRAAIAAGVKAVMTGHLLVPALDPDRLTTVSPTITGLLRSDMGFGGAVVTDALEMRAVSGTIGIVEAAAQALSAGADTVMTGADEYPELLEEIPRAVVRAVGEGRLSEERLADAAARTARLAERGSPTGCDEITVASAARRSLEIRGDIEGALRISGSDQAPPMLVVECRTPNGMATGDLPWSLADHIGVRIDDAHIVLVDGEGDVSAAVEELRRDLDRPMVLAVRDPDRFPWQLEVLSAARRHGRLVLVDLGWPADLPAERPIIRTRGIAPDLLAAAADAIADAVRATVGPTR